MTTTHKHRRIKRITPQEFTPRELRQLRKLYREAHLHPITAAQLRAMPSPFDDPPESET
jgi:cytochrome P450